MFRKTIFSFALAGLVPLVLPGQTAEHVDLNVIHKIKTAEIGEGGGFGGGGGRGGGRGGSKVMDTMFHLTDQYGPRLTNSPQFRRAGDWAVSQLKEWGMSNVHLENGRPPAVAAGPSRAGK